MEKLLPVQVEPLEEGGFLVTSGALPDLLAQGRTIAEALEIAQGIVAKLYESYLEHGDPLPPFFQENPTFPAQLAIPVGV